MSLVDDEVKVKRSKGTLPPKRNWRFVKCDSIQPGPWVQVFGFGRVKLLQGGPPPRYKWSYGAPINGQKLISSWGYNPDKGL